MHNSTLLLLCEVEMFAGKTNEITTAKDHLQLRGISRIIAGKRDGVTYPTTNVRFHIPYGELCLLFEYDYGYISLIDKEYPTIKKVFVKLVADNSVQFGAITRKSTKTFRGQQKKASFVIGRCCVEHISVAHPSDMTAHMQKVQSDFRNAFLNPEFGDISIAINGATIRAHKDILSVHSPVFAAMFNQKWRETSTQVVPINEFKFETMLAIVAYIYSAGNGNICQEKTDPVELLMAADHYQLIHLRCKCEQRLCDVLSKDNLFDFIRLATAYELPLLHSAVSVFANDRRHLSFN